MRAPKKRVGLNKLIKIRNSTSKIPEFEDTKRNDKKSLGMLIFKRKVFN